MSGPTMEFSELSLAKVGPAGPSLAPMHPSGEEAGLPPQVGFPEGSFAELAAEIYGVLGQSGKLTAETLRPLLDLVPASLAPTAGEGGQNEEAATRPAFLMELLSALGVAPDDTATPVRNVKTLSVPGSNVVAPAKPEPTNSGCGLPEFAIEASNSVIPNGFQSQPSLARPAPASQAPAPGPKPEALPAVPPPIETKISQTAPPALSMTQVIESSLRALSILKLKVSSVTSVARVDDGWRVSVELVERAGVPDTSDVLGLYELRLDNSGNVLTYERTHMRRRCDLCR